jgi:hypothetical protein
MSEGADEKQMRLRYAGVCRVCDAELAARVEAIYERSTRTVRCLDCSPAPSVVDQGARPPVVEEGALRPSRNPEPIHPGTPGASARREYERRKAKREARIREKHPKLGGLILAMTDEPQSTTAWDTGAVGEERVGQRLNELASDTMPVLHDRRIPGTRANIDHIAVTPTGVYVIDPKRYKGRPTLKVEAGSSVPAPRSCSSAPATARRWSTASSSRSASCAPSSETTSPSEAFCASSMRTGR